MDDARLDELYGGDPAGFVARRDALARELRDAGDRDGAAAVKALKRPTAAAAVLNRLARERRAELRAVLDAGSELAAAQAAAVGGRGGGEELRGAQRALRAAIDGLVAEATRGESAATAEKVRGTLHAAASHEDVRATVAAGLLEREVSPSGFGPLDVPVRLRGQTPQSQGKRAKADEAAQRREREKAEKRRRDLRAAKEAEAAAEHELTAAQAALAQVEARLTTARADVREADKRAAAARQRRERLER